jgi:hypothetical protein
MRPRHEIPTHLGVEDKAFYGLTARQVMYLMVGLSAGYALWNAWPHLPLALHAGLSAVPLVLGLIFALIRPHGRGLDAWAFVALHYLALPKLSVWRPGDYGSGGHEPSQPGWEELTPQLSWREETP